MDRKASSDQSEKTSILAKKLSKHNIDIIPHSIFNTWISIIGTPFDCILEMVYLGKSVWIPKPPRYFTFCTSSCSLSVNNKSYYVIIVAQAEELELPLSLEEKYLPFDKSDHIIIAFDKGNRQSFTDITKYLQICRENKAQEFLLVLLGFITDQEEVTTREGEKLAQELACSYFETRPNDKEQSYNIYRFIVKKHLAKLEKETFSP